MRQPRRSIPPSGEGSRHTQKMSGVRVSLMRHLEAAEALATGGQHGHTLQTASKSTARLERLQDEVCGELFPMITAARRSL